MRPGQNKRMRGRPSNNRRGPNPLTRSYESNGPDVKIRGNAHHVAEKYLQLARDAHTGGDPVAAENYLQHAEHYFRLIAAAQAAQLQAQGGGRPPGEGEAYEIEDEDDGGGLSDRFASPPERAPVPYAPPPQPYQPQPGPIAPSASQPYAERAPGEGDRQGQADRGGVSGPPGPSEQPSPGSRPSARSPVLGSAGSSRASRGATGDRANSVPTANRRCRARRRPPPKRRARRRLCLRSSPRRRASSDPRTSARPSPRRSSKTPPKPGGAVESGAPRAEPQADGRFPGRGRRRRLRSPYGFHAGANADEEGGDAPVAASEAPISE